MRYGPFPPEETIASLLKNHYRPYHQRLRTLAEGNVICGIDCHTMLAIGPAIAVAISFFSLLACTSPNAERADRVTDLLRRLASHLDHDDRSEIAAGLMQAERESGVDVFLLLAVAEEESDFRPRATGRRGALGLLQIRPSTGRDVARRYQLSWEGEKTLFDPSVNLVVGALYLRELRERFGSWDLALTAYNHGPTRARRIEKRGRSPSSRYAARVLERFESFRGTFNATDDTSRDSN
jgi:soluble lytic murein transglycosylase-like protein